MLYILFLLLLSQKCKSDTAVKKQKQTGSKQTRRVPVQKVKTKSEGDKLKGDTVAKKRRTKKKEVVSVLCLYVCDRLNRNPYCSHICFFYYYS